MSKTTQYASRTLLCAATLAGLSSPRINLLAPRIVHNRLGFQCCQHLPLAIFQTFWHLTPTQSKTKHPKVLATWGIKQGQHSPNHSTSFMDFQASIWNFNNNNKTQKQWQNYKPHPTYHLSCISL